MRTVVTSLLVLLALPNCFGQTWTENVACIIYSHCTSCHNPQGIAPFSLVTYEDATAPGILDLMEEAVEEQEMPPWPPSSGVNDFIDDRSLTTDEIILITHWIEIGAPYGPEDSLDDPPVYTFESIPDPDLTIRMPEFTVPPLPDNDMIRCFPEESGVETEKFITAVEVIPGNRQAVHHAIIFADTANTAFDNDSLDAGIGYECQGDIGSSTAEAFIGYAPGAELLELPEGMGVRLLANSNIVSSTHYPVTASGLVDSMKINFKFSDDSTLRPVETQSILSHLGDLVGVSNLFIPADSVRTFYQYQHLDTSLTVLRIFPHAHFICTYLYAYAILPNEDSIPLVEIPNWDQHWQGFYSYQSPVILPEGTELHAIGIYDNRASNPNNPSTPPQDVHAGSNSTDEMMIFAFTATGYQDGDSLLVFDTLSHFPHHNDCNPYNLSTVLPEAEVEFVEVKAFPNPATEVIKVRIFRPDQRNTLIFRLRSLAGEMVFESNLEEGVNVLRIPPDLPNGLYTYTIYELDGKKFSSTGKIFLLQP